MTIHIGRRDFISALWSGVVMWSLAARAQQPALPVVGFVNAGSSYASWSNAFRQGLNERSYVEGQNVMVEYHWLDGQYDRLRGSCHRSSLRPHQLRDML
jgi:putative tryptophan/tyrosine transport system substrate-binding protein